jgi:Ca2+-binding RTX toxin-like protein
MGHQMQSILFNSIITATSNGAPLSGITLIDSVQGYRILATDGNSGDSQHLSITESSYNLIQHISGTTSRDGTIFRQLSIDGVATVFTLNDRLGDVQMSTIQVDGLLNTPITLGGSAQQAMRDIVALDTNVGQIFVATHHGSSHLTSFTISTSGQMQVLSTLPSSADHSDNSAIAAATVDGRPLVLVASADQDSIVSYSLSPDGVLSQADSRGAINGLGINGPAEVEVVGVGDNSYVILAATQTSSLTVLHLESDGSLTVTDHIIDNRYSRFQNVQSTATLETEDRVFVLAGGTDDGLTLLTLLPDGTLQHLATIAQTQLNGLEDVSDVSMALDGDQLILFALGQGSDSFSVLTFDLSELGDILQAPLAGGDPIGGTLDDIIQDGPGIDVLTGGAGADIFALEQDGYADTITDFQLGTDTIDLSRWGQIYSLDALQFSPLTNGVLISFGEEVLTVLSHDGSPLTQADFEVHPIFLLDRTASDQHHGNNSEEIDGIWIGTEGDDVFQGTSGDDEMLGFAGNDLFSSSLGADLIDGGEGIDEVSFFNASQGATVNILSSMLNAGAAAGDVLIDIENIGGSNFDDDLTGDNENNQIIGWGGSDILVGWAGDDVLAGGDGDDWLNGGTGNDTLAGGEGNDTADYAQAAQGVRVDPRHLDLNLGEAAGDRYIAVENFSGGSFDDNLRGTTGSNIIHGLDGDDWLFGRWGPDTLYGGEGNDVLMGGADADAHFGGNGRDRADYRESAVGIRVDLMIPSLSTGIAIGDTFDSIEDLAGGYASDNLRGDHNDNTIIGRSGDDILFGRNGDDLLEGGEGDDTLYGGQDADGFIFTSGYDRLMDFSTSEGDILYVDASLLDGAPLEDFGHVVDSGVQFIFEDGNIVELVGVTSLDVPYEIIN